MLTSHNVNDQIDITNSLSRRSGCIVNKAIDADFVQKSYMTSRCHANDPCPLPLRQLYPKVTNPTCRSIDQHRLPSLHFPMLKKRLPGRQCSHRECSSMEMIH